MLSVSSLGYQTPKRMCNVHTCREQDVSHTTPFIHTQHNTTQHNALTPTHNAEEHDTYNHRLYLDELVQRDIVSVLELFADVEEVDLGAGRHDADQGSVVCPQALKRQKQDGRTFFFFFLLK